MYRKEFNELFDGKLEKYIEKMDFANNPEACRMAINKFIEQNTYNEIRDLLQPGDIRPSTKMMLANAVYFKSNWILPFDEAKTKADVFYKSEKVEVKVDMMHKKADFQTSKSDDSKCVSQKVEGKSVHEKVNFSIKLNSS